MIVLSLSNSKAESALAMQAALLPSGVDSLEFTTIIQPILQKNCSPCHFPGGKMYATIPFDKCEAIINHAAGALKRFSDKKENELVKLFIEKNKPH